VHGTLNLSDASARFEVVGQPGAMTEIDAAEENRARP
jgi:hypothetical protein